MSALTLRDRTNLECNQLSITTTLTTSNISSSSCIHEDLRVENGNHLSHTSLGDALSPACNFPARKPAGGMREVFCRGESTQPRASSGASKLDSLLRIRAAEYPTTRLCTRGVSNRSSLGRHVRFARCCLPRNKCCLNIKCKPVDIFLNDTKTKRV